MIFFLTILIASAILVVHYVEEVNWMATAYTIRNFPEELHRKAKAAAALEGITLRELILKAVAEYVEKGGE